MKKKLKLNIKFKRTLCVLLCAMFCFQALTVVSADAESEDASTIQEKYDYEHKDLFDEKYKNYYLIANIEDDLAAEIGAIDPTIDELLDLYVESSLYDLTREQAITSMVRKFLIDNYDLLPYMGQSLLKAYDPFGRYYSGKSLNEVFAKAYRGYGFTLDGKKILNGYKYGVIIDQVFTNTPAANAGLLSGDEIIAVDGMNVENLGLLAVSNLFASFENEVSATVRRDGKEISVKINKSTIYVPSVSFTADKSSSTVVIKITDFLDDYMLDDLYNICLYIKTNEYKNIIFDLRGNIGGDLLYMLYALNFFVPDKNVELCTMIYKDGSSDTEYSSGEGIKVDKICILADKNSASAAEIFALSLRDITGAVIIGETTYGKGVGQFYFPLENGDTAAITSFEILSSNRTGYHKKGVEPDIKIPHKYVQAVKNTENQPFAQLNFVNCRDIKKDADNNAVLALNQRLAGIGYISPEDISSKCTEQTIKAVEIFQRYNNLHIGLSRIDYTFLDYLNTYLSYAPVSYEENDIQYECAEIYISKSMADAKNYAEESANNDDKSDTK